MELEYWESLVLQSWKVVQALCALLDWQIIEKYGEG